MLDQPVPLREDSENVLVQFITHGAIGEYVIDHCLENPQDTMPIFVDYVDEDGEITIRKVGLVYYCCAFSMFKIIGTLVEESSAYCKGDEDETL